MLVLVVVVGVGDILRTENMRPRPQGVSVTHLRGKGGSLNQLRALNLTKKHPPLHGSSARNAKVCAFLLTASKLPLQPINTIHHMQTVSESSKSLG